MSLGWWSSGGPVDPARAQVAADGPAASAYFEEARGDTGLPALLGWERLDSLPGGGVPPLRSGDLLRIRTFWNRSDLEVAADLTLLDPTGPDSLPVLLEAAADTASYLLAYTLPDSVTRDDGANLRIPIEASASLGELGDTTVVNASSITVCLSNTPPVLVSATIDPPRAAYRGGDIIRIRATWQSEIDMNAMRADLSAVEPGLGDSLISAQEALGNTFTVQYSIPVFADDRGPEDVPLRILLFGDDNGCGTSVDSSLTIVLDEDQRFDPVLLEWTFEGSFETIDDEPVVRNGETVRLRTRWDREGLALFADFFAIAPEDSARAFVEELGGGEYRIVYAIPADNAAPDGSGRVITLIAEGPPGERTIDESVTVCLSNRPPVLVRSRIDPLLPIYTRGDTVRVVSTWSSALGTAGMSVGVDVSHIQPGQSALVPGVRFGTLPDSFVVEYRIPFNREDIAMDGHDLVLPLVGRDAGCGITTDTHLTFTLDVTPPAHLPTIDPLPAQTSADSIVVSGFAPGAARVGILSFSTFRVFVEPDSSGRYAGTIELLPDRANPITALSEDAVGNRTLQTEAVRVLQISAATLLVPAPFTRGDEFLLRDPRGLQDVSVRLFDVEGSALREWRVESAGLERAFAWDGTDANGERAGQGYFFLRAEWTDHGGARRKETVGLILQD